MNLGTSFGKICSHSHINGLGLESGEPEYLSEGMAGQISARKSLYVLKKSLEYGYSNLVVLSGSSGTGKTALAIGLGKEMKRSFSFVSVCELKKKGRNIYESLVQLSRKNIVIKMKESYEVVMGEVVEIKTDIKNVSVTLKTTDMQSVFQIGEKMLLEMRKERVEVGDIIRINKTTGKFRKIGRSIFSMSNIYPDANAVQCPEGELIKNIEEINEVTMHEIDMVNSKFNPLEEASKIRSEVREEVDREIKSMVNEGRAIVEKGLVVVEDVEILDLKDWVHFNSLTCLEFTPLILVLVKKIEDVNWPKNILEKALLVKTESYNEDEIREIIKIRCEEESVKLDEVPLKALTDIGLKHGLKYSLNLLTFTNFMISKKNTKITAEDINKTSSLFSDPLLQLK